MTNKDLQREYRRLNERFFGGQLPMDATVKFSDMDRSDLGLCSGETIEISNAIKNIDNFVYVVLLHEMAHLSLPEYAGYPSEGGHGMRFQAELVRLFNAGAYDNLL